MAKHLDKFTRPFRDSAIPFLLAEVITNGSGELVDVACRFLNAPAAALLELAPAEAQGRRLSQLAAPWSPRELSPLQAVAFSGSSATFPLLTAAGRRLNVTCYQVMYGMAGCLLEPASAAGQTAAPLPEEAPCADLELSREGVRCLACNRRFCQLTQREQRFVLDPRPNAFSALVEPADWPALLQALLDAGREGRPAGHDFRLLRGEDGPLWVSLRGEPLPSRGGAAVFRGTFTDIDLSRRQELALRHSLSQQEKALHRRDLFLEQLPIGLCLLRRRPEGALEALWVNQALCRLLGLNAQELLRRLSESPSALLADGDRAGALAAARRARKAGTPLQRVCRAVSGDGRELRLSLHVTWAPQADGTCLICAACADITQEAADGEASRRRAQLCDLLLEHSSLLTLDYDPAADLARIERYGAGGRRTFRMVSGYLKSLASASYLHPEDRRRLASAVRRAVSKPGTISCTYRADYEGTGWRWYQVSWMSLFDENGDVGRLLGKAEDVTASRAAAEHYRRLTARHRRQARTFLAAARLDLTADQTLDAKAAARHLLRALFERTAAACLQRIAAAVPDEAQRAQFHSLFSPEALAEAYGEGDFRRTLDHTLDAGRGPLPVRTAIELSENPDTSHLEAFVQMQDLRPEQEREALLGALAGRDYLLVITVDAAGKIRVWGPPEAAPADGASCRSLAVWYLRQLPPSPERTALRRALRPEALQARLAASPAAELTLPGLAGLPVILRCSALESPPGTLLVTCRAAEHPPAMFSPEK